jgi:hypothetical protein
MTITRGSFASLIAPGLARTIASLIDIDKDFEDESSEHTKLIVIEINRIVEILEGYPKDSEIQKAVWETLRRGSIFE